MKLSTDGLYKLYPNCANDVETGETIAVWHLVTREPHPNYPETADFLAQYGDQIPDPDPL